MRSEITQDGCPQSSKIPKSTNYRYEEVYIKEYQSVADAVSNLRAYFTFYNQERLHQA